MFSRSFWSKKGDSPKKDKQICLVVDQYTVSVRRSALVKHSAVFKKMAENGELKKSKEVKLKGVTPTGLQKIVEYIRSDSVYFQNHREAIETLRAAYIYQVPAMNDICSNFLVTAIDSDNVCDIFEFVASHSFHLVEYHCLRFIDQHAGEVLENAAFLSLKKVTVTDIIKRHSLNVSSEFLVFRAILAWATNDCLKRGVDPQDIHQVLKFARPLMVYVRFTALSDEELTDPNVDRVYNQISSEDSSVKRRSLLNVETRSRSGTGETVCLQSRKYVPHHVYELEMLKCDEHAVKIGESFCLRIEILKGKVFLTGITLAFERFVSSRNTSCLYAAISATNVQTAEQRCARGTFMTTEEEATFQFPNPLTARESERVEIALQVKRAVNICSVVVQSDIQIAMPDSKEVAMKIVPSSTVGGTERSMFKSVKYFY